MYSNHFDEKVFRRRLFTLSAKPTGSASGEGCLSRFKGECKDGTRGVAVSFFPVFRCVKGEVGGTP